MEMKVEQMIIEDDDDLIVPMSIEYREDITTNDFKELCRLCGNISNQLMPIFTGEGLEHNLPDKIRKYLPIHISLVDGLPVNICYECASTLISWNELYYGTKEADKRLREVLSRKQEFQDTNENLEENLKDNYDDGVDETDTIFIPCNIPPETEEAEISAKNDLMGAIVLPAATDVLSAETDVVPTGTDVLPTETNERYTPLNSNVYSASPPKFRIVASQVSLTSDCYGHTEDGRKMTRQGSLNTNCNLVNTDDVPSHTSLSSSKAIPVADSSQTPACNNTHLIENEGKDITLSAEIKSQLKTKTCDTCSRKFLTSVNLIVHLNELHIIHANPRLFQISKPARKAVVEILKGEDAFECGDCHEIFGQKSALRVHIINEHLQVKKLECDICHWRYETICDLATHRSVHALNEKLICRFCGGRCRFSVRRRYEATTNLVMCRCSLSTDSSLQKPPLNLPLMKPKLRPSARLSVSKPVPTKVDTNDHRRKSDEWWNQTKKPFPSVRRIQNVHTTRCELCDMECGSYYALKKHKRTHNERVHCDICNKQYRKHYLKTHMLIHGSEKTFACDKCGKSFAQKSSLRAHQMLEDNVKKFMCNICGEQFVLSSRMQWHMKKHMDAKPHKCVDCNKEFGYLWQLNQHRVAHSDERKFVCENCTKAYKTMKHLRQHWQHHPSHGKEWSDTLHLPLHIILTVPLQEEEEHSKNKPFMNKCTVCCADVENGIFLNDNSYICINCAEEIHLKNPVNQSGSHTDEPAHSQDDSNNMTDNSQNDDVIPNYCDKPSTAQLTKTTPIVEAGAQKDLHCALCSKTFIHRGSLISHLQKHDILTCKICNRSFKSFAHLKTHKKRHIQKSVNNTLIYCEVCKKYFKTKKGFAYHQQKICIQHKCYICDETFATLDDMQDHIKCKHNTEKIPVEGQTVIPKNENETIMNACPICSKVVTQAVMPRHMLLHTEDKPFICDLCGKQFKRKHSLQDHIMIEMGMKNYVCDICGMKFLKQGYLNKHLRYHKMNNGEFQGFRCEVCSKQFPEKWRLGVHQRAVHKGGKFATCKCDICDKQFAERWMVRKHKHVEHNGEEFHEYVCDFCGKKFLEKWMMKSHQRTTHCNNNKRQYCDLCGRNDHVAAECMHRHVLQEVNCQLCGDQFSSNYLLKEHVNATHNFYPSSDLTDIVGVELLVEPEEEVKGCVLHICSGCGEQFLSKQALKQHEAQKRCRSNSKYECLDCDKVFTSRFTLSNHLMFHKKASLSIGFKCDFCEKDFLTAEALANHLSLDKICLLCDQVYPCNDKLKTHVFLEHNDDDELGNIASNVDSPKTELTNKSYECKLCGKKFNRKQAMKNHLFAEMNLRRYVCEFCDKSYNYYSHLKEHLVTNHGEKEHICGYCGKDFPSRKRFRDHVTLHSEDKPFQCVCGLSFKLNRYLSKHKKHCKISKDVR